MDESSVNLTRLRNSVDSSFAALRPFRQTRKDAVDAYAGRRYANNAAMSGTPVNLMQLAVNIYTRQLAARRPRAMVTSDNPALSGHLGTLEMALDRTAERIDLGSQLRQVVLDAMFGMGVLKIGRDDRKQLFVEGVDFDDVVLDMSARNWSDVQFIGNRYYATERQIRAMVDGPPPKSVQFDDTAEQTADRTDTGSRITAQPYEPRAELWDIWLPDEKIIITVPCDGKWDQPLQTVHWHGPPSGPYRALGFYSVPGKIMPLSPSMIFSELHDLENDLFNKLRRQAERQKTVLGVRTGSENDGSRVVDSNDGDTISLDDPNSSQEHRFGGPDQPSMAFSIQVKDLFSYLAGNLDTLGGLSPMADTLGQEQMLSESSSKLIADMQHKVTDLAQAVFQDLAHYLWNDPDLDLILTRSVPGTGVNLSVNLNSHNRQGDIEDYDITIQPYSMQHQSPAAKLNTISRVWQEFIAPNMQVLASQGRMPDFDALMSIIDDYADLPELRQIMHFIDASQQQQQQAASAEGQPTANQPTQTRRTYVRESRSTGGTRTGRDQAQILSLLGNDQGKAAGG